MQMRSKNGSTNWKLQRIASFLLMQHFIITLRLAVTSIVDRRMGGLMMAVMKDARKFTPHAHNKIS